MKKKRVGVWGTANIWLGHFFVGIGFAGLVLPLLPGTVFFILAAWFYARGSDRFHNWLVHHKIVGQHIRNYRQGKITLKGKIVSVSSMGISIALSIWLTAPSWWMIAILVACFVCVTVYLLKLETVN